MFYLLDAMEVATSRLSIHDASSAGAQSVGHEIVSLVGACIFWWIVFYSFYHCKSFCQVRQRKLRQQKLLAAYRKQSEEEQTALAQHWPWPEPAMSPNHAVLDLPDPVPRQRRNTRAKPREAASPVLDPKSSAAGKPLPSLVPVMISTPLCTEKTCKHKLRESASELCAPRQDIRCLVANSSGFVQTQLHLGAQTANKLREIAAKQFCNDITIQLGRWRACCLTDGEVMTMELDGPTVSSNEPDEVVSDENDQVPVILYSSYEGGTLTVEGLNLANATIEIASKNGDCMTLETKSSKGEEDLEVHTCMSDLLEERSVAVVSVIAFKMVPKHGSEVRVTDGSEVRVKDGYAVRVSSLPVQIRDDSLKIVLRDILPFAILLFYAGKRILWSVIHATPTVAWMIPLMIIALTQLMPQRTEPTIKHLLKKMTIHVTFTFYYAFQTFMYELRSMVDEEEDDFLSKYAPTKRPRSRKQMRRGDPIEEYNLPDDEHVEPKPSVPLSEDEAGPEAFVAAYGSGSVLSPDWQWPIYDTVYENNRPSLKRRTDDEKAEITNMVPFVVVYLNLKELPWANQVQVNISSPFLKELLPGETDRWKCKKIVTVDGPELFRSYEELRASQASSEVKLKSSDPSSRAEAKEELQHIKHLVRFMDQEFETIQLMYDAMKMEQCVSWDMLWAFLPPRTTVVYLDEVTDEKVCGEVIRTDYRATQQGVKFVVKVTKWDYNCKTWSQYTNNVSVPAFVGDRAFSSLDIRPTWLDPDQKKTEETFLEHGKRFCELSMMESNRYMNYRGSMVRMIRVDNCHRIVKENADGRVMIDLGSFSKMNPDYPLGSAKPPCAVIRDNMVITRDITNDTNRMFAPSFVYGFSFRLKKWGCFSVCGFTDIEFQDGAYDDLVMNPATKALTESLVREHLKASKSRAPPQGKDSVDPIANKGEGCILLCYGPPGTGKTLTAESLSEKLHCPLWCLSVFELGITPAALETMLVKVLDVVASWGAILLLDEADVYLERRSSQDLVRNAMTGVFLRQLEYYRGVLFLTTNRDSAFDEAICSRVAMFLYYGRHDHQQRSAIWSNLVRRMGLRDITAEDLDEFSRPDFNGREIRKIMKTAQTLAKSEKSKIPGAQHVRQALRVYDESSKLRTALNPPTEPDRVAHKALHGELSAASTSAPSLSDCPQLTPTSSSHFSESLDPSDSIEKQTSIV